MHCFNFCLGFAFSFPQTSLSPKGWRYWYGDVAANHVIFTFQSHASTVVSHSLQFELERLRFFAPCLPRRSDQLKDQLRTRLTHTHPAHPPRQLSAALGGVLEVRFLDPEGSQALGVLGFEDLLEVRIGFGTLPIPNSAWPCPWTFGHPC